MMLLEQMYSNILVYSPCMYVRPHLFVTLSILYVLNTYGTVVVTTGRSILHYQTQASVLNGFDS
jgi:uncharacterized membrane protein